MTHTPELEALAKRLLAEANGDSEWKEIAWEKDEKVRRIFLRMAASALEWADERSHMRCKITNNVCGTDTWMKDHPCLCESCQRYVMYLDHTVKELRAENAALVEALRKIKAGVDDIAEADETCGRVPDSAIVEVGALIFGEPHLLMRDLREMAALVARADARKGKEI